MWFSGATLLTQLSFVCESFIELHLKTENCKHTTRLCTKFIVK